MKINIHDNDNDKQLSQSESKTFIRLIEDINMLVDGEKAWITINVLLSMALNQMARTKLPKEELLRYVSKSYDEILDYIEKENDNS
jgi:transcriptional/translational regulatory protein YebC/TACO1